MNDYTPQDSWFEIILWTLITLSLIAGVIVLLSWFSIEASKVPQLEREIADMKAQMLIHGWATYAPEGSKFQWVEKP
jgi:heme/copper-type cytochrome/quinol oxidase subunit 2